MHASAMRFLPCHGCQWQVGTVSPVHTLHKANHAAMGSWYFGSASHLVVNQRVRAHERQRLTGAELVGLIDCLVVDKLEPELQPFGGLVERGRQLVGAVALVDVKVKFGIEFAHLQCRQRDFPKKK